MINSSIHGYQKGPLRATSELVGQTINVPGAYWQGRMSAAEKETLYKCVVREHSALHKFSDGTMKEAFELQEMGAAGTGSLEHGDASGDIFGANECRPQRGSRK